MANRVSTITEVLSRMADAAREVGRPAPVITTDLYSAIILKQAIREEFPYLARFGESFEKGTVAMFDGVKIEVPTKGDSGFRDHFGVLAEIYA